MTTNLQATSRIYGILAEFEGPEQLIEAAQKAREAGYRRMDAYTPFPVEGVTEALGMQRTVLPLVVLIGGLVGAIGGYFLQYYAAVISYPLNVGGRPLHSWPAFFPVAFELGILGAAFAAVFGMLALNGLPQPYHPVFNIPSFELASRSHFFLSIQARDGQFDIERTRQFLESLNPTDVSIVEY